MLIQKYSKQMYLERADHGKIRWEQGLWGLALKRSVELDVVDLKKKNSIICKQSCKTERKEILLHYMQLIYITVGGGLDHESSLCKDAV